MKLFHAIASTALPLCLAALLGIGAVSDHVRHAAPGSEGISVSAAAPLAWTGPAAVAGSYAPVSGAEAAPAGAVRATGPSGAGLAGFPHHAHRDERLIDEEHELFQAAPHTLWRFHSGTA